MKRWALIIGAGISLMAGLSTLVWSATGEWPDGWSAVVAALLIGLGLGAFIALPSWEE